MTQPQIPAEWHPETYAIDELNKVVWKQGSHAVAMGLQGKKESLIPGYTIKLCTRDELIGVRNEIKAEEAKRAEESVIPKEKNQPKLPAMFKNNKLNTVLLAALIATQIPGLVDRMKPTYASIEEARRACWKDWVQKGKTYTITDNGGYFSSNPREEYIRSCRHSEESRQWLSYTATNRSPGQKVKRDGNRGEEFTGKTYRY